MSAVMMILINVPTTRVPGKGRASRKSRTDGGRRPARDDKQSQHRDRKWEDSPWRTVSPRAGVMRRRKRPITVASVVKVLLIRKFCVVSVRKKPASTAKTPVRHRSRPSGSDCSRLVYPERNATVLKEPCAGWRQTAKRTMWWMKRN